MAPMFSASSAKTVVEPCFCTGKRLKYTAEGGKQKGTQMDPPNPFEIQHWIT